MTNKSLIDAIALFDKDIFANSPNQLRLIIDAARENEQLRKERDELAEEVLSVINQALYFPSVKEGTNCITLDAYYALEKLRDKLKSKKVRNENGNA